MFLFVKKSSTKILLNWRNHHKIVGEVASTSWFGEWRAKWRPTMKEVEVFFPTLVVMEGGGREGERLGFFPSNHLSGNLSFKHSKACDVHAG
ncbi:hypothetical protein NC651_008763 [Populus alba x Populus x berolinensis]|nr:hypothetical protein NC651_008763 [Populus alba x Populus x berolinensis]